MKLGQAGRSLVECSVTLALVGITAALAVPQLASVGTRYRERAVVSEFAGELRTARMLAMTRRQRVEVELSEGGESLDVIATRGAAGLLRRYDLRGRGVSVEAWPSNRTVWFHPSGRTASPLRVSLRGAENRMWTVSISMTGRIGVS